MSLSRNQPRGKTGCSLPITLFTLAAAAIHWYSGEVVGQDPTTGIVSPLVPGLKPVGVSESSIDYTGLSAGEKAIEVRTGRAIVLPQDGSIAEGSAIGTSLFWDGTNNVVKANDGGGAYAYLGPLVVCRDANTVEVAFEPELIQLAGGIFVLPKTITHADLNAAALSQSIAIGVAPGAFLGGAKLLGANFTGGGSTSCLLDVGGTDVDGLIDADDVFAGPLAEDFAPVGVLVANGYAPSLAGQTINALFTSDANVSLLTAGSVTIHLYFTKA